MRRAFAVIFSLVACVVSAGAARAEPVDEAVTPLSFADFYRRPIGPRGLEPTPTLLALSGRRVLMSGFAVHGAELPKHLLILAPMPVSLSDEDERLADDLPASVVYVDTRSATQDDSVWHCDGRLIVNGELETGARREPDERTSYVRLRALAAQCLAVPFQRPAVARAPHVH